MGGGGCSTSIAYEIAYKDSSSRSFSR